MNAAHPRCHNPRPWMTQPSTGISDPRTSKMQESSWLPRRRVGRGGTGRRGRRRRVRGARRSPRTPGKPLNPSPPARTRTPGTAPGAPPLREEIQPRRPTTFLDPNHCSRTTIAQNGRKIRRRHDPLVCVPEPIQGATEWMKRRVNARSDSWNWKEVRFGIGGREQRGRLLGGEN